jgi:DNA-binding protein HU-beta
VTKAEVIVEIASKTGMDKADVSAALEAFFSVVKNSLARGENVYVRGFGSFVIKHRKEKVGRIIAKNESIVIPAHNVPSFKPAKVFVEKVKNADIDPGSENGTA